MKLWAYLLLAGVAIAVVATWGAIHLAVGPPERKAEKEDRPMVALWRRDCGPFSGEEVPNLRFAVWADGRVLYAQDPKKWGHELRRGKLSPVRVARLKAAIADTGIFDLRGTCYLVPDAPEYCLMVDLGGKQQMLSWDEVEVSGYGINIDPKPHHREFKRCWKAVNHLALVALPDDGEAVKERFQAPRSWYIRPAVQSE
jgi:hypothetical protein